MKPNLAAAVELKACPFCGGPAWTNGGMLSEFHGRSHIDVYVECRSCKARGQEFDDCDPDVKGYADQAIAAWNHRPPVAGLSDSQIMELWQAMNNASKYFCSNNKVPINEWAVSHEQAVLEAAREFLGKVDG